MQNNPEWKPFIKVVKAGSGHYEWEELATRIRLFMRGYPKRLQPIVALALSLAKWYLIAVKQRYTRNESWANCGCCLYYQPALPSFHCRNCKDCPLEIAAINGEAQCIRGTHAEIYARIHRIYTEHFNALPARDRQKARKQ